jgi:hypothetical protein
MNIQQSYQDHDIMIFSPCEIQHGINQPPLILATSKYTDFCSMTSFDMKIPVITNYSFKTQKQGKFIMQI